MTAQTNNTEGSYDLKSDLAKFCLPAANQDPNRKLAWVNSICFLFLIVGLFGVKPAMVKIKAVQQTREVIPTIIEPQTPPPTISAEQQNHEETEQDKTEAQEVVVVIPETPNIKFSVPTVGRILVPNAIAKAPPANPLKTIAQMKTPPTTVSSTGTGGERPQPPYPRTALQQKQQGSVVLLLTVDEAGIIVSAQVKESSGYESLDRSTLEFVKNNWTVPPGNGKRSFLATITYRLQ